jgi:NADPH:quinone reductase-like Zn-dependent oxidoreductase
MRALRFHQFGLEFLTLEEVRKPRPQASEVLVRIQASSINSSDVKGVEGRMAGITELPRIPGRDFAGIIEQGPPNLVGREVWGTGGDLGTTRDGTAAEYTVIPIEAAILRPDSLSPQQAASMGVAAVTAWTALVDRAALRRGETLLVMGAGGSVGHAAVSLGWWAGAKVIAVDMQETGPSTANSLNARSPDFQESLRREVGKGVDVAFDTVGGVMFDVALGALGRGGRMVAITAEPDQRVSFELQRFYREDIRLFGLNTLNLDAVSSAMILQETSRLFETGWLKPREIEICRLSSGVEAYRSARQAGKKRVLVTD